MRAICVLTQEYAPQGGGIGRWARGMAGRLSDAGYEVTVLTRWRGPWSRCVVTPHAGVRLTRMHGRNWPRFRTLYALVYLGLYLRRHPAALVIATTWGLGYAALLLGRMYPHLRYIVVGHGVEITRPKPARRMRQMQRCLRQAAMCIAVSDFSRQAMQQRAVLPDTNPVVVLPNGIDPSDFSTPEEQITKTAKQFGLTGAHPIILTLARVVPRKGHTTVIRALPALIADYPDLVYLIAGSGPLDYIRKLKDLAASLDVGNRIIFSGRIPDSLRAPLYCLADVYVMVSAAVDAHGDSEGFGITFLEAGLCRLPVIGSFSGGIPDAIAHNQTGYIIPPGSPADLASSCKKLFECPGVAAHMGTQAMQRVLTHFTWQAVCQKFIADAKDASLL